ncbi:MAG: hypothetical protein NZ533_10650 [Casimicrobiaceae bacterium]|nr:hypothetical protein [Casimicrobiaceae bacterium]MCX8098526.1 hypothetical protein [Casimicrobiaceae bacterium]MDW8312117.1 hypothetical protein [Burkholderiales bacterium]
MRPSARVAVLLWLGGFAGSISLAQPFPSGEYATVPVTRIERDRYQIEKTDIIVHTRYCHAYARREQALITTRAEGMENLIYFAGGDVCEIVEVERPSDRRFGLLDFLVQLGLLAASKATGGLVPMPKR